MIASKKQVAQLNAAIRMAGIGVSQGYLAKEGIGVAGTVKHALDADAGAFRTVINNVVAHRKHTQAWQQFIPPRSQ
jgi:hypothetical protein